MKQSYYVTNEYKHTYSRRVLALQSSLCSQRSLASRQSLRFQSSLYSSCSLVSRHPLAVRHSLIFFATVFCFAVALVVTFAVSALSPQTAYAYYNRGEVSVELGTTDVTVQADAGVDVTVTLSPAADEQTEGCGMAKCPQSCADSCFDENGQCTCLGTEYQTYYPTAVASSSDSSVAVAVYRAGVLTIYGRAQGEADVTVRASLRQFTDGEASVHVSVDGVADAADAIDVSAIEVDVPDEASTLDDRQDVVDKTVMGRLERFVRITADLDAPAYLAAMAGTEGDLIFWSGDTSYHPNYSVMLAGDTYAADDIGAYDPAITVLTAPQGTLYQYLDGLDRFVVVDFAQQGTLPTTATVYADAEGALNDNDTVSLFSFDEDNRCFVREDTSATVTGGYISFAVDTGKTYVVSSRDLTTEANNVVTDGAASGSNQEAAQGEIQQSAQEGAQGDNAASDGASNEASTQTSAETSTQVPPFVIALIVIVIVAVVIACVVILLLRRHAKAKATAQDKKGDEDKATIQDKKADEDKATAQEKKGDDDSK